MPIFSASRPLLRLSSKKAALVVAEVAVVATVAAEAAAPEVVTVVAVVVTVVAVMAAAEADVVARSLPTKTSPPCE